jgi:hypothetical protein
MWWLTFGSSAHIFSDITGKPRHRGRPGRRENAVILDRELKLEPLALVVGIDDQSVSTTHLQQRSLGLCNIAGIDQHGYLPA